MIQAFGQYIAAARCETLHMSRRTVPIRNGGDKPAQQKKNFLPIVCLVQCSCRHRLQEPYLASVRQGLAEQRRHDRLADVGVGAVHLVSAQRAPESGSNRSHYRILSSFSQGIATSTATQCSYKLKQLVIVQAELLRASVESGGWAALIGRD